MRRPRWQLTLWRLMAGVAIVALALAATVVPLHRLAMANYHRDRAAFLEQEATRGELMCMTPKNPEGPYIEAITQLYGPEAGSAQRRAFAHRRLARACRRVAFRLWLPSPSDPALQE